MKKSIALILALVMVLSLFAGCGGSGSDDTPETTAAPVAEDNVSTDDVGEAVVAGIGEKGVDLNGAKVGFSVPTLDSEFFVNMAGQIEDYLAPYGVSLTALSANVNAATQIENIENFTTMGMDVIVLFLVDNEALVDTLIKARQNGAYVIVIGTILENKDAVDCCLNVDQAEAGEVAAKQMAAWVDATFPDAEDGSVKIAVMTSRTNDSGVSRSDAMLKVAEYSSKINMVGEYEVPGENDSVLAQQYAETIFTQHPDVSGILCYGSDMAVGANEIALQKATDVSQFCIVTVDTPTVILEGIQASENNGSVIRATVALGAGTPYTIYQLISGEWSDQIGEDKWFREPCYEVDLSNWEEYYTG